MAHIRDLSKTKVDWKPGQLRWQVRYRAPDGKEKTQSFATKPEADRWLAATVTEVNRGEWIDPQHGRMTLAEWVERWQATSVGLRPSTVARDESYTRTHILPAFGRMPLAGIGHLEVTAWVARLSKAKAPATVVKAAQILSKIMQGAVDARLIQTNPCANVKLPRVEREEMRFLTPDQVATLADSIHPRYRALVFLGAYGGLRIGELAGLKRTRVDELRRRVEVAEIVVEISGVLTWGQPKTRAGRRAIALPSFVMAELADHMAKWSGPELVFTAPEGGPLRVPAWRRRFWLPGVADAGLEGLRPHDLRHTAVALWIAAGAKPLEVSRRAGHTSVSFSLDRYGHLFPEADDDLADRLDNLGRGAVASEAGTVAPLSGRAVE